MTELIGWIGSIMFALCGLPQAILCIQQGHSKGVSRAFLGMWLVGELCFIFFTLAKFGTIPQLLLNYLVNLVFVIVIGFYMIYPRGSHGD